MAWRRDFTDFKAWLKLDQATIEVMEDMDLGVREQTFAIDTLRSAQAHVLRQIIVTIAMEEFEE